MACLRPTAINFLLFYSSGISAESKSEAAGQGNTAQFF
jgi:hypothetical protein